MDKVRKEGQDQVTREAVKFNQKLQSAVDAHNVLNKSFVDFRTDTDKNFANVRSKVDDIVVDIDNMKLNTELALTSLKDKSFHLEQNHSNLRAEVDTNQTENNQFG